MSSSKTGFETDTPQQIVKNLDSYIIGQSDAKRSVAIALRNRWRRMQLPNDLRNEVTPKNIILIGSTGVGKTEIARRLAQLTGSPFIKVEASKFTEVGYVGRDVESMIRDLIEIGKNLVREEYEEKVQEEAKQNAEEKVIDLLLPASDILNQSDEDHNRFERTRERFKKMLKDGELDEREVAIEIEERGANIEILSPIGGGMGPGMDPVDSSNLKELFSNLMPTKKRTRKMKVPEAYQHLLQEESQNLIDMDIVIDEAVKRVEEQGIIFIDEIDKIASKEKANTDISREGVQRDLLPIVEGSSVTTKYGIIQTDHILFIAAGAFHISKPSDLIPELQGRFPIRVELNSLTAEDFVKILTEPQNALITQYRALLETEDVDLIITDSAIQAIAEIATEVNHKTEDIGARRLHTVLEQVLGSIMFDAPDQLKSKEIVIDETYVKEKLDNIVQDEDLSRYVL